MPQILFALCCKGTHGTHLQWILTIFMVHETFIVTTSGKRSLPLGSVRMHKANFQAFCPKFYHFRAAAPPDWCPLMGRTWQDMDVVAPQGTDDA